MGGKSEDSLPLTSVDACLAREGGIAVAPTDWSLARQMGHLLAAAARGSEHHVDASATPSALQPVAALC